MLPQQDGSAVLLEKWDEIINDEKAPKLTERQSEITAQLLENTTTELENERELFQEAAPTNVTGGVGRWDPIMLSMVRRAVPQLLAYDIVGVQPMTGPVGQIFYINSHYTNQTGPENLFNFVDNAFTGDSSDATDGWDPASQVPSDIAADVSAHADFGGGGFTTGTGMPTAKGEDDIMPEVGITVDKVTLEAKTRAIKASYSMEMAQDMKALHNLDADSEFTRVMLDELVRNINSETVRTLINVAKVGAQNVATPGLYDLNVDNDGRWFKEKLQGLQFQIERESNKIAYDTREGKGNILICSDNIASALAISKMIDTRDAHNRAFGNAEVDITNSTYVGMFGRFKVFVDPDVNSASATGHDFMVVGYKGDDYRAGMYYAPYVPFQLMRQSNDRNFQPSLAFKTRYGMVQNPFVRDAAGVALGQNMVTSDVNQYYRKFLVANVI